MNQDEFTKTLNTILFELTEIKKELYEISYIKSNKINLISAFICSAATAIITCLIMMYLK